MATSDQEYNDRIIRRSIGLSHPAAVRAVDRLVERGLVRRRRAGRGAAAALTATAAGRREAGRILDVRRRVLADALPELAEQEGSTLSGVTAGRHAAAAAPQSSTSVERAGSLWASTSARRSVSAVRTIA
jgi:DNA-binding MarR family transcriptional regulator